MKEKDIKELFNIEKKHSEINKIDKELFDLIEGIEDWLIAGKITAFLLNYGKSIIKKEVELRELATEIEFKIQQINRYAPKTVKLAFPVNISLDNCAAHYSPSINDKTVFKDHIIKLDIGININGAIGDAAITVDLSKKNKNLVKAAQIARDKAIAMIKPDVTTSALGQIIEKIITSYGLRPIKNLGGHQIERFNLHAGIFIPNYDSGENIKLKRGNIIAIEPFASTGSGYVKNSGKSEIFVLTEDKKVKNRNTKKILNSIDYFDCLPFSRLNLYNLSEKNTPENINVAFQELMSLDMIHGYNPLSDNKGCLTSQSEHTVIVGKKAIITTEL